MRDKWEIPANLINKPQAMGKRFSISSTSWGFIKEPWALIS